MIKIGICPLPQAWRQNSRCCFPSQEGLRKVSWATSLLHGYPRPQQLPSQRAAPHLRDGLPLLWRHRRGFPSCDTSSGKEGKQERERKKEDCILLHAVPVLDASALVPSSLAAALCTLDQPFCHTMVTSTVRPSNPPQPPLPVEGASASL